MTDWNFNLITLTANTDEAKKQLHMFIDKHVVVLSKRNLNVSLLELDSESIFPIPEGIVKLMNMGEFIFGDTLFTRNPNYDEEAEQKQRAQNFFDYGYTDCDEFCINEWGSKWGFCDTCFLNESGKIIDTKDDLHENLESIGEIKFKTDCAECPATGLMKKICELYPDIEFRCEWGEEQVVEYYGVFTYDKAIGWKGTYKNDMDVDEAYNMLIRIGLISANGGYFPNHNTGMIDYEPD